MNYVTICSEKREKSPWHAMLVCLNEHTFTQLFKEKEVRKQFGDFNCTTTSLSQEKSAVCNRSELDAIILSNVKFFQFRRNHMINFTQLRSGVSLEQWMQ